MTFRYGSIPAPRLQAVKVVNNSVISKDLTSGESVKQKEADPKGQLLLFYKDSI